MAAYHFISIMLSWDRHVTLSNDANSNGLYYRGYTFQPSISTYPLFYSDYLINKLSLYLFPVISSVIQYAVSSSFSVEVTLQHIFFQVPTTGEYEICVQQTEYYLVSVEDYVLSSCYSTAPPLTVAVDYNIYLVFFAQYYALCLSNFFYTFTAVTFSGNSDSVIDAAYYVLYRKTSPPVASA